MARTLKRMLNFRDTQLDITTFTAVAADDVTNGVDIVNFFENVDNSGALILTNVSANTNYEVTIKANAGNVRGGLGDLVIDVPFGKTLYVNLDDSSRFGQLSSDFNSLKHVGLWLNFETGANANISYATICKQPADYVTPAIA